MDGVYEHEIEQGHVTAEQHHRDHDHESRISQLLVFAETFFVRIPRPGSFLKLDLHFVKEVFCFSNHGAMSILLLSILRSNNHARRDSNPQQAVLETATLPIELLA